MLKKHWRFVGIGDRLHFDTETSSCQIMLNPHENPHWIPWNVRNVARRSPTAPTLQPKPPLRSRSTGSTGSTPSPLFSPVALQDLRSGGFYGLPAACGAATKNFYTEQLWLKLKKYLSHVLWKLNTMHSRTANIFHIISVFELGVCNKTLRRSRYACTRRKTSSTVQPQENATKWDKTCPAARLLVNYEFWVKPYSQLLSIASPINSIGRAAVLRWSLEMNIAGGYSWTMPN